MWLCVGFAVGRVSGWWEFGGGTGCGVPQGLDRSQNPRIENSARDQTGSTCSENEWMSDRVGGRHPSRESLVLSLWTEDCPLPSLGTEKLTTLGIQRHFKAMHRPPWNWNFLKCMNFLKSVYMFIVESLKNTNRDNEKNWKHSATIQQKQDLVWLFFTQQHFIEKIELDSLFTHFHAV